MLNKRENQRGNKRKSLYGDFCVGWSWQSDGRSRWNAVWESSTPPRHLQVTRTSWSILVSDETQARWNLAASAAYESCFTSQWVAVEWHTGRSFLLLFGCQKRELFEDHMLFLVLCKELINNLLTFLWSGLLFFLISYKPKYTYMDLSKV